MISIHFKHRIHEEAIESVMGYLERNGLGVATLEGVVEHIGYLDDVALSQGKKNRDLGLLEAILKDAPRDVYTHFKRLELARYWNDEVLWHHATMEAIEQLELPFSGVLTGISLCP